MERETFNASNMRFSATRIEQLTDEEHSHVRPHDVDRRDIGEPGLETEAEDPNPTAPRPTDTSRDAAVSSREPVPADGGSADTPTP
jgi:hypothetical protein